MENINPQILTLSSILFCVDTSILLSCCNVVIFVLFQATEDTETIAKSLQETVDGKIQFKCPTAYDMKRFMEVTEVFIKAFSNLLTFIKEKEGKVEALKSFPVKEEELKDLTAKLFVAMALPLWD